MCIHENGHVCVYVRLERERACMCVSIMCAGAWSSEHVCVCVQELVCVPLFCN